MLQMTRSEVILEAGHVRTILGLAFFYCDDCNKPPNLRPTYLVTV